MHPVIDLYNLSVIDKLLTLSRRAGAVRYDARDLFTLEATSPSLQFNVK